MPKKIMRRFIFSLTILILAINGIACACPVEVATDHTIHTAHSDESLDNQADCCNDCDELTATKRHVDIALPSKEKCSHQDFDAPMQRAFELAWGEHPYTNGLYASWRGPFLPTTPVKSFDRMLD